MQALVYVSAARALPTHAVVEDILASATRNNPPLGLTGKLLWAEMTFAQMLEGPEPSLDEMWRRLSEDPRHERVRLLSRWASEERLFGDWSMASDRLHPDQHWELMRRSEGESDSEFSTWILYLMNEVHRGSGRP